MKRSMWYLLPVLALCLVAGAQKQPEGVMVRFYPEAIPGSINTYPDPVYLQDPPRRIYRSKIATISETDISSIYLYQVEDHSVGCVFILNEHGRAALEALTMEKRGSSITAVVNDRMIINLQIDRKISDGIMAIPHGMTVQEGLLLKKSFKVIDKPPVSATSPPAGARQ